MAPVDKYRFEKISNALGDAFKKETPEQRMAREKEEQRIAREKARQRAIEAAKAREANRQPEEPKPLQNPVNPMSTVEERKQLLNRLPSENFRNKETDDYEEYLKLYRGK